MLLGNCKRRKLSPLQHKTILSLSSLMLVCASLSLLHDHHNSPVTTVSIALSLLPILPILGFLFVIARYLTLETDEFLRLLATRALLIAFGAVMIFDTVLGTFSHSPFPYAIFNMDIFVIVGMFAFAIQFRMHQ